MKAFTHFGNYWIMLGQSFILPSKFRMFWKELARQMNDIGVGSLFIVGIVNIFIGSVTGVQTAWTFRESLIPKEFIGYIVRDSILLELCPTITCIVLAGKIGSQITSEIGSMRISEQIDAFTIMGVPTKGYLIAPKILASLICVPLLIIIGAFLSLTCGVYAGYLSGYIEIESFVDGIRMLYDPNNIFIMLTKTFVFAFIFSSIACYQGYYLRGGAIEIGKASTRAVIYSNVFILIADYVLITSLT